MEVGIKEYFDRRLDDWDRRISDRFVLNETAVAKAEHTMNTRLNSMNEFRDALRDQANSMATRAELDKLTAEVKEIRLQRANFDGRVFIVAGAASLAVSGVVSIGLTMLAKWIIK